MKETNLTRITEWVIETDRRLRTILVFRNQVISGAAEIAEKTGRTIQNISDAISELDDAGIVECVGEHKHSWRKYRLTDFGLNVLANVDKELHLGAAKALSKELEYRYVKDAYQLIVRYPLTLYSNAKIHHLVERILDDPRTRTIYVVDRKGKLKGYVTLQHLLAVTQANVDLDKHGSFSFTNYSHHIFKDDIKPLIKPPISVKPSDKLNTALKKMTLHGLEDIAVVSENNRLIGELNGLEILSFARNVYNSIYG